MATGPQIDPTDPHDVYLTDGTTFLGPYQATQTMAIDRSTRQLREGGATEVHAVRANDMQTARAAWDTLQRRLAPAVNKMAPAKRTPAKKGPGGKRA